MKDINVKKEAGMKRTAKRSYRKSTVQHSTKLVKHPEKIIIKVITA